MAVDDGTAVVADGGVGDSGIVLVEQALPYLRGRELGPRIAALMRSFYVATRGTRSPMRVKISHGMVPAVLA